MAAYGHATPYPGGETSDPAYRDYNRAREAFAGYLRRTGYQPPCDPWCEGGDLCACVNDEPEIVFAFNDDDQTVKHDVLRALNAAADDYERTHAPASEPLRPVLVVFDEIAYYSATAGKPDEEPMLEDPLLDTGGYLACGCHGSQRDHTCGSRD